MNDSLIRTFEWRVKHILDWSCIDAGTKDVLISLMAEVAALAKATTSSN